jgi:hypothetical protein
MNVLTQRLHFGVSKCQRCLGRPKGCALRYGRGGENRFFLLVLSAQVDEGRRTAFSRNNRVGRFWLNGIASSTAPQRQRHF